MNRLSRQWRARREAAKEAKRLKREGPEDPQTLFFRAHTERARVLDEARRALADLAVQERRADLMAGEARAKAEELQEEAAQAARRGEDGRAHDLLDRVVDQERSARQWRSRREDVAAHLAESRRSLERMERQAEQTRTRQLALLADSEAADARRRVREAAPMMEQGLSDLDRRMAEVEALAAGRAEVAWHDSTSEQVARAFEDLERQGDVRARLQSITRDREQHDAQERRRLGGGPAGDTPGHP